MSNYNNNIEYFYSDIKESGITTLFLDYCNDPDFYKTTNKDLTKRSPTQIAVINETEDKLNKAKEIFCSSIVMEIIDNKQIKDNIDKLKNKILQFGGLLTVLENEKEQEISYINMKNIYDNIYEKIDVVNRRKDIQINSLPYNAYPSLELQEAVNDYYDIVNNNEFILYISTQTKLLNDFMNMLQIDLLKLINDMYVDVLKLYNIVMTNFNALDNSLYYIPDNALYKIESVRQLIISTTDDVETIIEKESKLKNIKYMKTDEIYSDGYTNSLLDLYKIEKRTNTNLIIIQQTIDKVILENGYTGYSVWSILSCIFFIIILILTILFFIKYYYYDKLKK